MQISLIDVLIVLLSVGAGIRGYQIGLLRQASSTIGFIIGLYPGTLLSGMIMPHVGAATQPLVGLAVILIICFACMTIGEIAAIRIKHAVQNRLVHKIDNGIGAFASVITLLIGMWLAAALLGLAPPSGLQQQIRQSAIISSLNRHLPPITSLLHKLNTFTSGGQTPDVFAGKEPAPGTTYTLPSAKAHARMLDKIKPSVLKVEGLGCGGIIDGSSFVYAPGYAVTNAHVIAGVASPKVSDERTTYDAVPVLFDSANDIAVLKVEGLSAKPLPLHGTPLPKATHMFTLGYPGGGNYTIKPAAVLDIFDAAGQDIYGTKRTTRNVYSLQTELRRGNSGGPVIDTSGNVVGVVFATSTTYNNVGYALTLQQLEDELAFAREVTTAVSTGQCTE